MKILGQITVLFVLASCELIGPDVEPRRADELVQTDTIEYVARHLGGEAPYQEFGFQVITRLHNPESDTVFLDRCFPNSVKPIFGVQLISPANEEGAAYDPMWGCVGHENPIAIAPGATRVDTLMIRGPMARDGRTKRAIGVFEGVFRIAYSIDTCRREVACSYPRDLGRSNTFRVILE